MLKHTLLVKLFMAFVKLTGLLPALLFFKPRVYTENVRASRRLPKNCILVSNHKSLMDFVLYMLVFPLRTTRFLMAEVLFNKGKPLALLLTLLGGIRVDRNTYDFGFVSNALSVLDKGGTLGIFPEGRLPVGGKPFPFTVSTAFIASHTDAPIIPVFTDGQYGLFKRASVMIGEPIDIRLWMNDSLPEDERLNEATATLQAHVYALGEELERRKAGD